MVLRGIIETRGGKTDIPAEIRFASLRWRIDRLAAAAWAPEEPRTFELNQSKLDRLTPTKIIQEYLFHIRTIAPGFPVPVRIPEIGRGTLQNTGGTFGSNNGWAVMLLSEDLVDDQKAVRAVLAHEVCHYVLNCSGMQEEDTESNEKLTDLCMFVLGLGNLYLAGYRREVVRQEYRVGHRLGYLTDAEYGFARDYVGKLWSDRSYRVTTSIDSLRKKIAARVGDTRVIDRLIENERTRAPNKSKLELYRAAYENLDRGK